MKKFTKYFLIIFITSLLIETIFRIVTNLSIIDYSYLRIILSTTTISMIISLLMSVINRKIANILTILILFLVTFYAFFQITAKNFIGVYMSFNVASQAGAVIDYIIDYILCIQSVYYFILIPFILLIIYFIFIDKKIKSEEKLNKKNLLKILISIVTLIILFFLTITLSFMQDKTQLVSTRKTFDNPENGSIAIKNFGTTLYGILDIKSTLLKKEEHNENIKEINNYIENRNKQTQNEYTGYFKNKNLIVIMMESVDNIFINKEYYPNFYKLYNEGWHFDNNYSPRNTCSTGNNEFTGMTSLYALQTGCTTNIYKENKYNTSIFNLFNNQGYSTFSVHDYTDQYYDRHIFHKNMGSNNYYGVEELKLSYKEGYGNWPSDNDMMKEVLNIIKNEDKPFMSWITTVSSHQPYKDDSSFSLDYQDMIKEDYSPKIKSYMSKLKELDNSLETLLKGLEEQNILKDTVIILYADHYPYGINTKYIKEVLKTDLTEQEVEKTPFVIYNSKMNSKTFKQYTSYINITPTVANLFDLDYNKQNYIGDDLLDKNYQSRVVFQDGSWKNEYAYYSSTNGKIKYYKDITYTKNQLKDINKSIQKDIDMSRLIIKNNYFNK